MICCYICFEVTKVAIVVGLDLLNGVPREKQLDVEIRTLPPNALELFTRDGWITKVLGRGVHEPKPSFIAIEEDSVHIEQNGAPRRFVHSGIIHE